MDRKLVMHCYYDVSTSLVEKKSLDEIKDKLQELADKYQMSLLDLTEIALKISCYKLQIPDEDLANYRITVKEIRKPLLEEQRILLKRKQEEEKMASDRKAAEEKMRLKPYFDALIKAYNLEMPVETALYVISQKLNLNIDDIKNNSKIYLERYAGGDEKYIYQIKFNRQNRLAKNPTKTYNNNHIAFRALELVTKENDIKLAIKMTSLFDNATEFDCLNIKNIISKEYSILLSKVKTQEERNKLFLKEEKIMYIIDNIMALKPKMVVNTSPVKKEVSISKEKLEHLAKFLESNISLKDFGALYFEKRYQSPSSVKRYLESACKDEETKEELAKHLKDLEEYELSYLDTILDIVLYWSKKGINNDGVQRKFDIIDYYCLTKYPLPELRSALINNKLVEDCDLSYISTLNTSDDTSKSYSKVTLESFLNNITGYKIGDKMRYLTEEEKKGIFKFLESYNIPATNATVRNAVYRYLTGTLFLPSDKLDKQLVRVKKD